MAIFFQFILPRPESPGNEAGQELACSTSWAESFPRIPAGRRLDCRDGLTAGSSRPLNRHPHFRFFPHVTLSPPLQPFRAGSSISSTNRPVLDPALAGLPAQIMAAGGRDFGGLRRQMKLASPLYASSHFPNTQGTLPC